MSSPVFIYLFILHGCGSAMNFVIQAGGLVVAPANGRGGNLGNAPVGQRMWVRLEDLLKSVLLPNTLPHLSYEQNRFSFFYYSVQYKFLFSFPSKSCSFVELSYFSHCLLFLLTIGFKKKETFQYKYQWCKREANWKVAVRAKSAVTQFKTSNAILAFRIVCLPAHWLFLLNVFGSAPSYTVLTHSFSVPLWFPRLLLLKQLFICFIWFYV